MSRNFVGVILVDINATTLKREQLFKLSDSFLDRVNGPCVTSSKQTLFFARNSIASPLN